MNIVEKDIVKGCCDMEKVIIRFALKCIPNAILRKFPNPGIKSSFWTF